MWELDHKEGWVLKNWCFWTVVLEKTLESPLDCMEIKPVNPKGNWPWIFIEGLMLKLKLQSFGHLMWRTDSLEKTLMLGKIEGRRIRGQQKMRWFDSITDSMAWVWASSGSWWWIGRLGQLPSMGSQRVGQDVTEQQVLYDILILWGFLKRECLWSVIDLSSSRMAGIWPVCHLNAEIADLLLQKDKT